MAALTPVASVEALVSAIQKSSLLSVDKLTKVREAAAKATDPKLLARDLIKEGTLTKWQAGQLLHGYHLLVIGKYKLLDQIDTVPTGRLYLAEHAQMGRRHTLKVLAKRLASNPQAVKQFLSGAQNACGLDHHNISHVYDVNQEGDRHYVVMDFVEGEDLEHLVQRTGSVKLPQALDFIAQAAEGLAHAHENGVVHGDLKPSNLLLDQAGTIKILEIGQTGTGATFESEGADESTEMAALSAVIFQAPELRGDGEAADVACDVYSLGSVFCFLLTGKASPDAAAAVKLLAETPDVPAPLVELCGLLLAEKPAERPGSMAAVLEQLVAAAHPPAAPEKQKAWRDDTAAAPPKTEKPSKKAADGAAKTKKPPPVAKAMAGDAPPAIVIPGETQPVIEPEPLGTFVIKTRGRGGKQPGGKHAKAAAPANAIAAGEEAAAEGSPAEAPATVFTPLVLAGAIGGGGALVLGLIIAVVCVVSFGRGGKQVAQNDKGNAKTAATTSGDVPAKEGESNPVPAVVEKNPEVNPTLPPANESEIVPPAASTATAKAAESPAEPVAPIAVAPTPAETKTEPAPPPATKPEPKVEPKPAPKPVPKPARPKAAPKPAAKADPFKGLATAVSLPELPAAGQPAANALSPATLGPCQLDAEAALVVNLLGGDTATRGSRQKFELRPQMGSTRDFDVVLSGSVAPATIATLSAKEGNLLFQWTEDGVKQAAAAKQLCNCALELTVGGAAQMVALRTVVDGAPLAVEIDKPGAGVKWNIDDLPSAKQLFIEVTRAEEIKIHRLEPKGAVNIGDTLTLWTGVTEKNTPLALKLVTSSTSRGVEIKLQPQAKLEGQDLRPYRKKEMLAMQSQNEQELPFLAQQLEQAKRDRPSTNPVKGPIEKLQIDERKAALTVKLTQRTAMQEQINYLVGFTDTFKGSAQIHFRVYCLAGDEKINLLRTEEEPPPGKTKK